LRFQFEDLLIEREQLKIKKAPREDLLIEREQLKIKKAQYRRLRPSGLKGCFIFLNMPYWGKICLSLFF
jgi:hypothetical protein